MIDLHAYNFMKYYENVPLYIVFIRCTHKYYDEYDDVY